jgi:uncharacterized membrane protein YphA (DoxX/SURF4 family)
MFNILLYILSGFEKFLNGSITNNSNIMSFFHLVNKRAIYWLGIISLAHVPVHVTDFPVVNVHVDELSSARIWHHKLCATLSANVNINYHLPIKVYYRICTLRYIRIEKIHWNQIVFWVLTWIEFVYNITIVGTLNWKESHGKGLLSIYWLPER